MSELEFNVGDKVLLNPDSGFAGHGSRNPVDTVGEVVNTNPYSSYPYDVVWESGGTNDYPLGALMPAEESQGGPTLTQVLQQLAELSAKYEALEAKQENIKSVGADPGPKYRKVSFKSREEWAAAMASGRVFYTLHESGGLCMKYWCDIQGILDSPENSSNTPFRLGYPGKADEDYLGMPLMGCWSDWADERLHEEYTSPWYENIPEEGILCYVDDDNNERAIDDNHKEVVLRYEPASEYPFRTDDEMWRCAVPVDTSLRED